MNLMKYKIRKLSSIFKLSIVGFNVKSLQRTLDRLNKNEKNPNKFKVFKFIYGRFLCKKFELVCSITDLILVSTLVNIENSQNYLEYLKMKGE